MSMMGWKGEAIIGGILFSSEVAEDYEIFKMADDKFFVRRLVSDCDDIGPLSTFEEAENIVLKIMAMLVGFEEQAWLICAARAIKVDIQAGGETPKEEVDTEGPYVDLHGAIRGVDGELI